MSESGAKDPALRALRDRIDDVDRRLLELLKERMGVVADVARHKRSTGVRIRDLGRERELLHSRRVLAEQLGLGGDSVEAIYRQIMMASRDYQAQLGAGARTTVEPKAMAIVGGAGEMGQALARLFGSLGQSVCVADLNTPLTPEQAAAEADVVVICVPIRETEQVIRKLGPLVRPDALLMDVTSLKGEPVRCMLDSTRSAVLGTHPLFGPGVHSFQGQRVVVCPGRGAEWQRWFVELLEGGGMVITESSADEHDRMMALVQVLTHYQTQVMGLALARLGTPPAHSRPFTSPAYLLELYVTARHFAQSAGLYGPIEMLNPRTSEVTAAFQQAAAELAEILASGDQARFAGIFEEVRGFFGGFTEEALEQSRFLIDRLVERSMG